MTAEQLEELGELGFSIRESPAGGEPRAAVTPDSATCADCLAELFDPADRRFRYPFTNCTNCGPRFTIVRDVPYDRPNTTMAGFEMCAACRAEYEDPADRRFHAQPNACPDCGPRVRLVYAGGGAVDDARSADPVEAAARALLDGAIVAVKGLGGFHLACRADDEEAVARAARAQAPRGQAVRADGADARGGARPGGDERGRGGAAPVARAADRAGAAARRTRAVAPSVAPGAPELGVMLPYSPLHHLLLADAGEPLVMTSGNVSDEPIAYEDERGVRAARRHRRPVPPARPADRDAHRRLRGAGRGRAAACSCAARADYVPGSLPLPVDCGRHLLACGAELKNTFALAKGGRAWVGHHIGDLKNYETLRSFATGIDHFQRLFAVEPEVVAHDLHPDYLSTKHALELAGVRPIGVQHHHAHLAACLAEHGEPGPAIGAIFDGTGYGDDGTVWGGELLFGDLASFERVGPAVPGADARRRGRGAPAVADGVRLAHRGAAASSPRCRAACAARSGTPPGSQVAELARRRGLASPLTTSAGRLFDAVAALCGVRPEVNYEGQAAVELEAAADPAERGALPAAARRDADGRADDPRRAPDDPRGRARRASAASRCRSISARFHNALATATATACRTAAERAGVSTVVLSGRRVPEPAPAGPYARAARGRRPARARARAAAAERRRDRLRAAGRGERPADGRGGERCSGLTNGSPSSRRAAAWRSSCWWRCCSGCGTRPTPTTWPPSPR